MNTSKNIKLAIIFLIGALVGLIGYSRFFAVSSTDQGLVIDETVATTTETAKLGEALVEIQAPEKKVTKPVVSSASKKIVKKETLPLPNLDRIVINANISDDKKQEYTGRMKDITNAIRKGEPEYSHLLELASYRKLVEDYVGAEEIWFYMTKLYPDNRLAYENLGNLYHFYQRDYPKAEIMMKKAIESEVAYPYSYINLFELYTLSYKEKESLSAQTLLDGLQKTESNPLIAVTLAQYYMDKGNNAGAKTYFEKVLAFSKVANDQRLEAIAVEGLSRLSSTTAQQ
ncbi:MAG: hypothetical protein G01um101448_1012 [Parcubacteria group bacterium Gr01-1014_48]|nr:MAG: hypothetical protein Greene041614_858 [Parcubacteria group bacterium Greene0416_14]TSC72247.1 MAG: hypothetical protein G01um101448_1012 [Parcubacteria group bacterium Gr01-1014_48]TSC99711.1 MAG: hypothetical protein Greene101415_1113 [Parcubacteria group bacterium Greene1014_15]TSD08070.1 MAG: hypothetical protein Greene07144_420 [Parcubacteria group bacterium Greene0714_4]